MDEIGLFPLGIVLLPGEQVPLHIFEPRYRELIAECLDEAREFGLVLGGDDEMHEVGTTAAVVEVLNRHPDGRLDIVVEGRDRFRIIEETAGRSFRTARIELLPDTGDDPTGEEVRRCLAAFRILVEVAEAEAGEPEPGPEGLAFWIATRVDFGPAAKQELLELRSERERVGRLGDLLMRAAAALRFAKTVQERATGNGRVEPPG
jgi:Lon protease-like protein